YADLSYDDLSKEPNTYSSHGEHHDNYTTSAINTNFNGAILKHANLSDGNYNGADFSYAVLYGADLTNATFVGAVWHYTTCPNGTNTGTSGTC
ncbi:MAG TPA: pentapeptide repeat-containing protein, partial [Candidatus Thalassarchaeaceae archaeon]|nr:pentapeptide repeat-containing protein [Candidatus Thalassarchaeaceae archaeon]